MTGETPPSGARRTIAFTAIGLGLLVLALDVAAAVAPATLAAVLRVTLGETCHQDASRSFWLGGAPLGTCARCVGLHAGALLGGLLLLLGVSVRRLRPAPIVVLGVAPLVADALLGMAWPEWGSAWLRAATGVLAVTACVVAAGCTRRAASDSSGARRTARKQALTVTP